MMPTEPSDPHNVSETLGARETIAGIRKSVEASSFCTEKSRGYAYAIITMNIMQLILYAANHDDTSGKIDAGDITIDVFNSTGANKELQVIGPLFLKHIIAVSMRLLEAIFNDDHMRSHMAAFLYPNITEIEAIVNDLNEIYLSLHVEEHVSTSEVNRVAEIQKLQEQVQGIRANIIKALSDLEIKDESIAQKRVQFVNDLGNSRGGSVFDEAQALAETIPLIGSEILEDLKGTVRVFLRKYTPKPSSGGGTQGKRDRNYVPGGVQGPRRDASKRNKEAQDAFDARSPKRLPPISANTSLSTPTVTATFESETTEEIYNTHFQPLFKTALLGKNVVVFGYGHSGSGKTFTLIGNEANKGVLSYLFSDEVFRSDHTQISLKEVFEFYGKHIINSGNAAQMLKIKYNTPKITSLDELLTLLEKITARRKKTSRIKCTPYNNESSRSHFIIQLEVLTQDKGIPKIGLITFMDLGGREDPIEIFESLKLETPRKVTDLFIKGRGDRLASKTYPNSWTSILDDTLCIGDLLKSDYIMRLIREGICINDSLNRLSNFLIRRLNAKSGAAPRPVIEESFDGVSYDSYKIDKLFRMPKEADVFTTFLNELNSNGTTKFVMMCCVRNDSTNERNKFNEDTVLYANSLSSTNAAIYSETSGFSLNYELQSLQGIIAEQSKFE
jgi:hypothetical protein